MLYLNQESVGIDLCELSACNMLIMLPLLCKRLVSLVFVLVLGSPPGLICHAVSRDQGSRATSIKVSFEVMTSHCESETGLECDPVGAIRGKLGYHPEGFFVIHVGVVLAGAHNLMH